MKNRLFSAFLGGFFGILISAYFYHLSQQDCFIMLPLGTFFGCFLGFFWTNLKKVGKNFPRLTNFSFFKENIVVTKFLEKISKQQRIRRFFLWFSKHPMNKFMFFEGLALVAIVGGITYLFITLGFFDNLFAGFNSQIISQKLLALAKTMVIFGIFVSFLISFHSIFKRSLREFFANFEFYQRWNLLGVIAKTSAKFIFLFVETMALAVIGIVLFFIVVLYNLLATVFTIILIIPAFILKYLVELNKNKQEFIVFLVALLVATGSYFLYRPLFGNQILIWAVAFLTGIVSSLVVKLILKEEKKEKILNFYSFVFSDDEEIISWTGLVFNNPFNSFCLKVNRAKDYFTEKYEKILFLR